MRTTSQRRTPSAPPGVFGGGRVAGVAGAAALIGVVTVAARVVGFGRWLVFSRTVGSGCLADAYNSANAAPNIVFEVVAGGALASVVVPLLAGAFERGDREQASRVASALLTWTLLALTPLAVAGMLAAGPLTHASLGAPGGCPRAAFATLVARMLVVFLPQLPLYGVAVVLAGALQADRRFLAPALAPLASSLVVIGSYLAFRVVAGANTAVDALPLGPQLLLAVGTTLGVLALAATTLPALRGAGLRLRPTLSFPPGLARRARALAAAGVLTLLAQQGASLAILWVTNHHGAGGSLTAYTYTAAVYALPYAVLAAPIATSAFPTLSARHQAGDQAGYAATLAATTRALLVAAGAGAGLLAATAIPVARLFLRAGHGGDPNAMAPALVVFAGGLFGYALIAHLGRALYASGHGRAAAAATALGWCAVVGVDVGLGLSSRPERVVTALGVGNMVGMTLAGALLLVAVRRFTGPAALAGLARAGGAGWVGALAAWGAGAAVAATAPSASGWANLALAVACALAGLAGYVLAAVVVDAPDARVAWGRLRRLAARPARRPAAVPGEAENG